MKKQTKNDLHYILKHLCIFGMSAIYILILIIITININLSTYETEKTSNILNVLNWTSYIPSKVIKDFESEYNIKVNYGTYSSNEELLAKISSSKPGTYDVIFPSDYMVSILREKDLLEPLDTTKLDNAKNLNTNFLAQPYDEKNEYSLPFLLATSVIAYNSKNISEINSYQDLLNDKLKNNIVLIDDERIIIGAMLNATGHNMNDTDESALNDALEFYNNLKPNIKAFDSDSPKTFFITDEVNAGIVWNAEATLAAEDNPKIKTVYPKEGFALSMDNYVILKNSKNQENAYLFINYLLRDDVAKKIVESYPYISPNNSALNLSDEELNTIFKDGEYIKNVSKQDTKRFDELWARMK